MNNQLAVVIGIFISICASFIGLVIPGINQLTGLRPITIAPGIYYPVEKNDITLSGLNVYRSLGCVYCHTRSARPYGFGSDFERGWGNRRTVARDYIPEQPLLLGSTRIGPDLANIAARAPDKFVFPFAFTSTNKVVQKKELRERLFRLLYNPRLLNQSAMMPPHPFLFRKTYPTREIKMPAAATDSFTLQDGSIITPLEPAKYLVAFLMSLEFETPLFEAPPRIDPAQKISRPTALTNIFVTPLSQPPQQ